MNEGIKESYEREIESLKKYHADNTIGLYSKIKLYVDEVTRLQERLKQKETIFQNDIFTSDKIRR